MDEKELLPGWKTEELIGGGGFGKVYKIKKVNSEDEGEYFAALKIVNIPQSPDEYNSYVSEGYDDDTITNIFQSQLNKLISEFQLMAQMKGNSHIVSYEDHKVIPNKDGTSWKILIRMELLTPISKIDTMSVEDVAKLGIDICKGLEICKKKNIIHRDVKPQNIFVNDFGDYKLGDFGIARALDHATMATRIGTFTYMAPEVYYGRPYDETIDIYALGLVMYWLLNEKRMPFVPLPPASPNHEEIEEAQHSRLSGKTIPFPKNGSKNLKSIVVKACAHDPQDRFLSALEMRRALEKVYVEIKGDETTVLSNTDLLDDSSMPTVLLKEENDLDDKIFADKTELIPKESEHIKNKLSKKWLIAIPICVLILFLILNSCNDNYKDNNYDSSRINGDLDLDLEKGVLNETTTYNDTAFENKEYTTINGDGILNTTTNSSINWVENKTDTQSQTSQIKSDSIVDNEMISVEFYILDNAGSSGNYYKFVEQKDVEYGKSYGKFPIVEYPKLKYCTFLGWFDVDFDKSNLRDFLSAKQYTETTVFEKSIGIEHVKLYPRWKEEVALASLMNKTSFSKTGSSEEMVIDEYLKNLCEEYATCSYVSVENLPEDYSYSVGGKFSNLFSLSSQVKSNWDYLMSNGKTFDYYSVYVNWSIEGKPYYNITVGRY